MDMSNITDFLNEIEKLAYKILLWVLLLPKTLLKIILEPNWVPGYIKKELGGKSENAFDTYMSPVVLFLVVTLIPAILTAFIPSMSMVVHEPQPSVEGDLRDMYITVDANFISSTSHVTHKVWWEVWQVDQVDQSGNPLAIEYNYDSNRELVYFDENGNQVETPPFTFVFGELHDEVNGVIPFTISDKGERVLDAAPLYPSQITLLDGNSIEDTMYILFAEGEYQVRIYVENYDPNKGTLIESQSDTIFMTVPADETQPMYYDSNYMVFGDEGTGASGTSLSLEGFQGALESGGTYFLALGLLSLPLLFSFGTKILDEDGLGETSIKQSFYMQCYYFSPITAVFWATVYSLVLYTSDINAFAVIMTMLIFLLIVLWFLNAEHSAIMIERGASKGRAWGVLFVLIAGLTIGSFLIYFIITDLDLLRRYSITLYPILGVGVLVAYILKRRRERILKKQEAAKVEAPITNDQVQP
jgi:hypothetical protein